jgi:centromere protein B
MMKNKDSILSAELKCDGTACKHKNIKAFPHDELEKVMIEWSEGMCPANLSINGSTIREKTAWVALKLGFENFKASNGWLDRFKKWQRLTYKKYVWCEWQLITEDPFIA